MSKPVSFNYDDYRLLVAENANMKKKEADFIKQINTLERQLQCCRDELCLRCGRYTNAHGGACDGCRWKYGSRKAESKCKIVNAVFTGKKSGETAVIAATTQSLTTGSERETEKTASLLSQKNNRKR